MSSRETFRARAPGKLILSGEHAVVYGAPALGMAINRYMTADWTPDTRKEIAIQADGQAAISCSLDELKQFRAEAGSRLEQFREGHLAASDILAQGLDLLKLAVAMGDPASGGTLEVQGDIPCGSGMGSSAALILCVLSVLHEKWNPDELFRTALHCEHHQHGESSGLDLYTAYQGGVVQIESGLFCTTDAHRPRFRLFNTGTPASTTGDCVSYVKDHFANDAVLWRDFAAVTRDMRSALQRGDEIQFRDSLHANHRLLCHINVVPDKVRHCIREFESLGAAAKLCGAGAVKGERGGVMLVSGVGDFQSIVDQYQIEEILVGMDHDGLMRL